jgi:hypothetical protein
VRLWLSFKRLSLRTIDSLVVRVICFAPANVSLMHRPDEGHAVWVRRWSKRTTNEVHVLPFVRLVVDGIDRVQP